MFLRKRIIFLYHRDEQRDGATLRIVIITRISKINERKTSEPFDTIDWGQAGPLVVMVVGSYWLPLAPVFAGRGDRS
jgi:hypothetical protein